MPSAFIIINTDIGRESSVLHSLGTIDEVDLAYIVYGVYDIIAKVTAPDMDLLERTISEKVRKVEGVRSTLTLVVSRELHRG